MAAVDDKALKEMQGAMLVTLGVLVLFTVIILFKVDFGGASSAASYWMLTLFEDGRLGGAVRGFFLLSLGLVIASMLLAALSVLPLFRFVRPLSVVLSWTAVGAQMLTAAGVGIATLATEAADVLPMIALTLGIPAVVYGFLQVGNGTTGESADENEIRRFATPGITHFSTIAITHMYAAFLSAASSSSANAFAKMSALPSPFGWLYAMMLFLLVMRTCVFAILEDSDARRGIVVAA